MSNACRLHTRCDITLRAEFPTPLLMVLRPKTDDRQWVVREYFESDPAVWIGEYSDRYGNRCQRLTVPVGPFALHSEAVVETARYLSIDPEAGFVPIQSLPDDILGYLLPSRYCESDCMAPLAWSVVGDAEPGYPQVERIVSWVRESIRYRPGSSNIPISAREVHEKEEGVCRDLAHLAIAMCRALCIPARFVSGYLHELEPMDLHAWLEVFVGGRWFTFDPTQSEPRGKRVVIAVGRDAADVPLFNQFGPQLIPDKIDIRVDEVS